MIVMMNFGERKWWSLIGCIRDKKIGQFLYVTLGLHPYNFHCLCEKVKFFTVCVSFFFCYLHLLTIIHFGKCNLGIFVVVCKCPVIIFESLRDKRTWFKNVSFFLKDNTDSWDFCLVKSKILKLLSLHNNHFFFCIGDCMGLIST